MDRSRWRVTGPGGEAQVDFGRNVHALAGLPFDTLDLDEAARQVVQACVSRDRCFLSTPNVNFVVTAARDGGFRQSVLQSDLCVVDGMPLVWLARATRVPIRERVAGADLFERLRTTPTPRRLKVFFFGGPDGIAEQASEALTRHGGSLLGAGGHSPGFRPVDELSSPERIGQINAARPDLLLVALGAAKGQAWIMRNRRLLDVPVVSHLGAVVNFVAGTVGRAPGWMSRLGLEWVWRVLEEPPLWRRYWNDGLRFLGLLRRVGWPTHRALERLGRIAAPAGRWRLDDAGDRIILRLEGRWTGAALDGLRDALTEAARTPCGLRLVMKRDTVIDSAGLAQLMLLQGYCTACGRPFDIEAEAPELAGILALNGMGAARVDPTPQRSP